MNQILYNNSKDSKILIKNNSKTSTPSKISNSNYKSTISTSILQIKWYKVIFFISLFSLAFFIILLFIRLYKNFENEEIAKKLTSSYSISTLYSNTNTANYTSQTIESTPFVIRNNKNR